MTIAVKPAPPYAPGQGVAKALHRSQRWVKSETIAFGDTSPVNVFEIPGNVLVVGGLVDVITAFDASGTGAAATVTITVPNSTGTTTVYDASTSGLQTSGFKAFSDYALTPASGGYIVATYTAGTTTAGSFQVYMAYVEPEDEL